MNPKHSNRKTRLIGLIYGAGAFVLWGLLPLYWKLVKALSPYQIFSHRVVWSLVFMMVLLLFSRQLTAFIKLIQQPKMWLKVLGPAVFISINWLVYIWSVNSGYVIEASLGYFINPLVLTIFGSLFFKETITRLQAVGILLATVGVLYKTLAYGQVPWIALVLAFSFATYGLLKKLSSLDSIMGLSFETLVISLPALGFLITQESSGQGITGRLPGYFWILIGVSGIATATPLLMYAESTKRLPLNVLGFLQYISPSISLVLGIFIFNEAFDTKDLVAFSMIWAGLVCFSISQYQALKNM